MALSWASPKAETRRKETKQKERGEKWRKKRDKCVFVCAHTWEGRVKGGKGSTIAGPLATPTIPSLALLIPTCMHAYGFKPDMIDANNRLNYFHKTAINSNWTWSITAADAAAFCFGKVGERVSERCEVAKLSPLKCSSSIDARLPTNSQ